MYSEIRTFPRGDGEIQRAHVVRFDDWSELDFLRPAPAEGAFDCFYKIYKQYLVPAAPWVFGNLVMFRLPPDVKMPFSFTDKGFGTVAEPLAAAALALRRGVRVSGEQVTFRDGEVEQFWQELQARDCIRIVRGRLPITTIIPVGEEAGLLTAVEGRMKVNSSFFIMDPFDCATPYDHVGIPFGMLVKDGVVESPPLFGREALLVKKDGSVRVESIDLNQLRIRIGGQVFTPGENAKLYTRPDRARSPSGGTGLVVIGRRVAAVRKGSVPVPGSGFVLQIKADCGVKPGDPVTYEGMEDIRFGIQVGNSILRDGIKTEKFISKFFNIRGIRRTAFPPSLYPLDFEHARAARIALGADRQGKPMLLWAEGAAKLGHTPGVDSCGASLSEMADICADVGMTNAVNLDGGGSAQILVNDRRRLMISDRNTGDYSEAERPVPMGLVIR